MYVILMKLSYMDECVYWNWYNYDLILAIAKNSMQMLFVTNMLKGKLEANMCTDKCIAGLLCYYCSTNLVQLRLSDVVTRYVEF